MYTIVKLAKLKPRWVQSSIYLDDKTQMVTLEKEDMS
jgi:hypothetical protein